MGQRSQIYVRLDNNLVIANYYQWNYGERMISRARYGLERIRYYVENDLMEVLTLESEILKLSRTLDVDFDMKDVAISLDLIKEWNELGNGYSMAEYVFNYDNNDGCLFIWIDSEYKTVKYAFTDCSGGISMTGDEYMKWGGYYDYLKTSELATCQKNIRYIEKHADHMTCEELEKFMDVCHTSEIPFS